MLQNLSHELPLNYPPHSKLVFRFEHSLNNLDMLKSQEQCCFYLVQQIKLKDRAILVSPTSYC